MEDKKRVISFNHPDTHARRHRVRGHLCDCSKLYRRGNDLGFRTLPRGRIHMDGLAPRR